MRGRFSIAHKGRAQLHNMGIRNATKRQKPVISAFPLLPIAAPVASASKAGTKQSTESNK